jgi:hypothetical protein
MPVGSVTVPRLRNHARGERREGAVTLISHFSFLFSLSFLLCLIGAVSYNPSAPLSADSPEAAAPASSLASAGGSQNAPGSGICGVMVAAWGNAPANPPTYECVKIFDSTGQRLIATGVCSGMYGQFRIPLPPGRYLVDHSLVKSQPGVPLKAQPGSFAVDVSPGQWVNLAPKAPPGPIP